MLHMCIHMDNISILEETFEVHLENNTRVLLQLQETGSET